MPPRHAAEYEPQVSQLQAVDPPVPPLPPVADVVVVLDEVFDVVVVVVVVVLVVVSSFLHAAGTEATPASATNAIKIL